MSADQLAVLIAASLFSALLVWFAGYVSGTRAQPESQRRTADDKTLKAVLHDLCKEIDDRSLNNHQQWVVTWTPPDVVPPMVPGVYTPTLNSDQAKAVLRNAFKRTYGV